MDSISEPVGRCNNRNGETTEAERDARSARGRTLAGSPLGIYAKSTSRTDPASGDDKIRLLRADRYRYLATARDLFIAEGRKAGLEHPQNYARTAKCAYVMHGGTVSVHRSTQFKKAFFSGLVTCGSVWSCPVCSAKIQERRRVELAQMINWTWDHQLQPMMITFTAPHRRDQSLKALRVMQAGALKDLRSGNGGKAMQSALGYQGMVRSLELTYGDNGWHLHTHELWQVSQDTDPDQAKAIILERWRAACAKVGLLDLDNLDQVKAFDEHAIDVKGWCSASDYLAKMDDGKYWGADREMAKSSSKIGKRSGRHPFGLLADAADGCIQSGRLYVEYAAALKGSAQLYWSKGLKARVGVDEISDAALAERSDDAALLLGRLLPAQWRLVLIARARSALLDAAELGGWEAVEALLHHLSETVGLPPTPRTPSVVTPSGHSPEVSQRIPVRYFDNYGHSDDKLRARLSSKPIPDTSKSKSDSNQVKERGR